MRRLRDQLRDVSACCAALVCVALLTGCGSRSTVLSARGSSALGGQAAHAAACPDTGANRRQRIHAFYHLRSTPVRSGRLAPAGVRWTTVCTGLSLFLKGGPLDTLLDSARPYRGQGCEMVSISPEVVILRYANSTRRFVIDMGGCPGVVLDDGTKLIFTTPTLARARSILMAGLRPAGVLTLTSTSAPGSMAMHPPSGLSHSQRATFVAGEAVAGESGCEGCHEIGASGNNGPGPPLTHIGRVRRATAIAAALLNPTAPMPSFADLAKTSPKKFHELIQFLAMLK